MILCSVKPSSLPQWPFCRTVSLLVLSGPARLWVGGIPAGSTEMFLREEFGKVGQARPGQRTAWETQNLGLPAS